MDPRTMQESTNSLETDASYDYDSLDHSSTQFRLFTLLPSADKTSQLHGQLRIASFSPQQPVYEALSYVWGGQTKTYSLRIDNKGLSISQSLYCALSYIRHPIRPRNIWVDAICINQYSFDGKKHQVQKMNTIFSRAFRVLIWLGEADEDSNYAMAYLGHLDSPHVDIPRVAKIFRRSWWNRVWTLQEGLAASKDSLVLCGNMETAWETVIQDISYLLRPETTIRVGGLYITHMLQYFTQVHSSHKHAQDVTLESLVYASVDRDASNPRDHVYALLGLVSDPRFDQFEPDYSKPASWAYQKAMVSIFRSRMDLDFLLSKLRQKRTTELSWCVDFSKKEQLYPMYMDASKMYRRYSATNAGATHGRESFKVLQDIQKGTITLTGTVVGKVATTQIFTTRAMLSKEASSVPSNTEGALHKMQLSMTLRFGRRTAHLKVRAGDVWRTATGGRLIHELSSRPYEIPDGYAVMASLAKQGADRLLERRIKVSDAQFEMAWSAYRRLTEYYISDVCLFATDTNYIGSGSQDIQSGDILCILFGCKLPLVLRPGKDGLYKLINSVYADGVMNGEFLEAGTGYTEVDFVLN